VLAKGGKVLKGEDARLISPSVNTVYGHVDLDLVCEYDDFPEKEPACRRATTTQRRGRPAMIAWRGREEAWQPRTYRALLAGEKYDSVLIDDPKTKLLRELVPFKQAQQLLKKKGIDLPSYANRKRQTLPARGAARPGHGREKDPAQPRRARRPRTRRASSRSDREGDATADPRAGEGKARRQVGDRRARLHGSTARFSDIRIR
jgi:hypothetical protein